MSNDNSGYGGYNPYYYPTRHPQRQHMPDKRNAQRSSAPIQLPGGVSIGGGSSVGGIAESTSEYNSRQEQQQDYFGAIQQQSWDGQSTGQFTAQQSHGGMEYDAAQASTLATLGGVGTGRGSSLGVGSGSSIIMPSTASVNLSYQQPQHQQSQYPASMPIQKPEVTSQYYGQQQDTGQIVTTNPSAIQQPTSTTMRNTPSCYRHINQSGLHLPNSSQTSSSCNQNQEHGQVDKRQTQAQAPAAVSVTREYQTSTNFSALEPTQTSANSQEQAQLQRRQAMQTHNNVQSQAQWSVEYNDYQRVQKARSQQYQQAVNKVQPHAPIPYYQQNEQSLNTSNSRVQAITAISRASNSPANTYRVPTPRNHAYVNQNPNSYNTQSVTTASSVNATYITAQAGSSSDNYSMAYSTPVQRTPTLYVHTESPPSSKPYPAPQPPTRIQTPPQPVSKPSPRLQQQQASTHAQAQAQAHTQAQAQAQALKAHAEAQAKAQAEAEALVKQQAEALAKQQAEALAKQQAEALAKQQEDALAKQQAEKAQAEAEDQAQAKSQAEAYALAQARAKKQAQAKARQRTKAREKAKQAAEEQARQEEQAKQQVREEAENAAKAQQQMHYTSVTPTQTHSPPDLTGTASLPQQQQQQPPERNTISPSHDSVSAVVGSSSAIYYAEMERHMREMVERMRQYQTIDPTGFHAVWENVKKGGRLGGAVTPEPLDVSRETSSNADAPHIIHQQTPTSAPHQNAHAHARSSSVVLSPPVGPVHVAGIGYDTGDQGDKTTLSFSQAQEGMHVNPVPPPKPLDFTGGTTQSFLSDPSNHNHSASKTILHSSHGTQNVLHAQSQSGLSPLSYSRETPLFPPDKRPKLAAKASSFMANNGCNNPPLPVDWVKTLLDGNPSPSFVSLCETLESAGYTFGRSDFARALVPLSISDRDSGMYTTSGDHQIASLDEASEQSRGAANTVLVHDKSTDVQHSAPAQKVQKKPRGRPPKKTTSEVIPNSNGKNAAIIPPTKMPEAFAQSISEDIKSPESKDSTAAGAPAQPKVHDGSCSSSATSPMYPLPIPNDSTPQSRVQPEPPQPDKHAIPPHLPWHGSPSSHHPPFRSQSLFFNNDDISYIQDSYDIDAGATQWMTHKIPQPAQLSETTRNRQDASNVEVMNHSSHPETQAPTSQHRTPPPSTRQHVEQHEYVQPPRIAHLPSEGPVSQLAPVAPMVGMPPLPVERPAPPAHQAPVNLQVLDTTPPPEVVSDVSKLPPVLMLLGKEKIVKKISKRKAARVSAYDPKTIARNVLLATGRHPNMAPLNSHLFPLLTTLSNYMDKDSDLETLRWDLIDPPEGTGNVELLDDDDDLVMGDLEPVARAQSPEKDLIPSPPQPRKPRSRHRWKKSGEEDKGSESKQEKGKERRKEKVDDSNAKSTPALSNPPAVSSTTGPKSLVPRPHASLGGLLNSAVAAHSATDNGSHATISGALTTSRSTEKNAEGVGKEAAASPRPRSRDPRMRLVGPLATPRAKPEETAPKASSWTPVNKVEDSASPRSKLAAVVIQPRAPSAAESGDNSVQTSKRRKRKNEVTEGSIRPKKRALIDEVGKGGSSPPPMFDTVKCGWKDCRAQLHTGGLLRKHAAKVHKHKASFGGYPCYWEGCSRLTASGKKGPLGVKGKVGQYLDFDTEKEWEEHMESAHLSGLAQLEEADDGNGSDTVRADFSQSSSAVKENHIPLPPPPSQPQGQPQVKHGPQFKSMLGRRGSGIIGIHTPVTPKVVVEAVERSPSTSGSRRKPTSASRARAPKAAPLSTVHVLSDDD
ncbi:hypothetical protein EV426DRAFT_704771 [Tirmania nivea]|nr:hypothetical protein EV426DRAFT_704771 [Tirmania nivea]